MARYFSEGRGKRYAKMIGNDVFMRTKKDEPWSNKGGINTDLFLTAVSSECWLEISALEAGDRPYADCSQCAENWPELFDYHPDGHLVSKVRRGTGAHVLNAGDAVRGTINKYSKQIRVNGKRYQLHRIVWEMFNGPIPDGYRIKIHDSSCVRIENLELISWSECIAKGKTFAASGLKGIYWDKSSNKWYIEISLKGMTHYLGRYDNINNAINARILGEIKYYGKQLNDFPAYISPEEEERIKQRYYEGNAMKQIEINTEPPELVPEFEYNTFRFKKRDIRINSDNYINLVDLFRAMHGGDSEKFRQAIASFEQVPVFDSFIDRGEDYDEEYFAPPLMAQMFAQRLGGACDGVELIATYHTYCNVMLASDEQADSKEAEDLKGQISELQGLLNIAREDCNSYQKLTDYWQRQYKQANKAFGDERGKRQKLESERDNLVESNCELRQKLNAANNDDAKVKAVADKQTINDLRTDLQEAKETIKAQQQEADSKALVIRGYQLKVAELEDDKAYLQRRQQRYRKLVRALQQRVKDLLYRLDKKPESRGFWSKIKDSFHVH